jgi:dihydrofolate reductase
MESNTEKLDLAIVVAADLNNGIGHKNQLLCHLPDDLKYFKKLTSGSVVLMGRKTFESIGRPLPNRRNIVLSKSNFNAAGIEVFSSLEAALEILRQDAVTKVFIIGGAQLYTQYLNLVDVVYLTRIHAEFEADAFFPQLDNDTWVCRETTLHEADDKHAYSFSFETYQKITH